MNFIVSLLIASIIYKGIYSTSSKNEKILKEKGIEGIPPKSLIATYRKKGMSDEKIVEAVVKIYQNNKKWAPVGAVIGFILMLILSNFFKMFWNIVIDDLPTPR